jgi:hypothetical protein
VRVRAVTIGRAVDRHPAAISGDNAAKNLDPGGYASALLAEKRDDLAAIDVEAHALERLRAPERLVDILETQDADLRQVAFFLFREPYFFVVALVELWKGRRASRRTNAEGPR